VCQCPWKLGSHCLYKIMHLAGGWGGTVFAKREGRSHRVCHIVLCSYRQHYYARMLNSVHGMARSVWLLGCGLYDLIVRSKGLVPGRGKGYPRPQNAQTVSGTHPSLLFNGSPRPGLECETNHSPSSSAELRNAWDIHPRLLYAFMAWCLDEAYLFYIRTQCVPRCKHSPFRL
jgi:hypothetical protein